jgi:Spy/CpxP family protein refolding chaperone
MFNMKIRQLIMLTATATLFFCQSALASTAMDSIGTGSSGSYSHGATKSEGSKSKKTIPHHISGKKSHYKSEGSKSSSHHGKSKGHSYSHKKPEGSSNKHHARSRHSYSKGHKSGHGGHSSKCPFSHLLRFKDKLGLTEVQIAEIKRLRFEYGKQSVRNKAEHKIAHMEFDRVVHAEKVDAQAIRAAAGKIAETKTKKIMAKAEAKIALLNLLTDEQRKKAHAMHSAH